VSNSAHRAQKRRADTTLLKQQKWNKTMSFLNGFLVGMAVTMVVFVVFLVFVCLIVERKTRQAREQTARVIRVYDDSAARIDAEMLARKQAYEDRNKK
jgi:F0F1-type ATP synthase membrane subunit b/b'